MRNALAHPSCVALLDEVKNVFKTKTIAQKSDRHIVFVCGGPVKKRSRSVRNQFLKYASTQLPKFRIFLAEAATKDLINYDRPEFINIAEFESLITDVSDCIVLFPESAGSIAEAGFFANSKAIKTLLIVSDYSRQNDSFINIGITELVNRNSNFRTTIFIDYKKPNFDVIKDRLNDRLPKINSKKFIFDNSTEYSHKELLYIIFQIIYIFRALKFESIIYCFDKIFGKSNKKKIKLLLSILIAANYIKRIGVHSEYFCPEQDITPFLEFNHYDTNTLTAKVASFYQQQDREVYDLLGRV